MTAWADAFGPAWGSAWGAPVVQVQPQPPVAIFRGGGGAATLHSRRRYEPPALERPEIPDAERRARENDETLMIHLLT